MPENELRKLQANGFYRKVEVSYGDETQYGQVEETIEELTGQESVYDDGEVAVLHEVHCNLDLEGFEDLGQDGETTGIKLPYIVTVEEGTRKVFYRLEETTKQATR